MGRPPAVQIRTIVAKARDLERLAFNDHEHDTKLGADRNGFGENVYDIVRPGIRRDIIILRRFSKEHIAHTPTRQIALVALFAQTFNDRDRLVFFRHRQTTGGYPRRERSTMEGAGGKKL